MDKPSHTRFARWAAGFLMAALLCASCATAPSAERIEPAGSGREFLASSTFMSANPDWGHAAQAARFTPGVLHEGLEAIELAIPYGETTVAYNFGGFQPGQPVEIGMDVNFDFYRQNGFIYLSYLSGSHPATIGTYPRPALSAAQRHKWIDSVGRFAGEPWPDTTDGWQTLREVVPAGDDGCVSLVMMVNHWEETPPAVYGWFTNPQAKAGK